MDTDNIISEGAKTAFGGSPNGGEPDPEDDQAKEPELKISNENMAVDE
jgi:hypothetical protein